MVTEHVSMLTLNSLGNSVLAPGALRIEESPAEAYTSSSKAKRLEDIGAPPD